MAKTYDEKCGDLADHFLVDEPALIPLKRELALTIQEAVEDWFASKQRRAETAALNSATPSQRAVS